MLYFPWNLCNCSLLIPQSDAGQMLPGGCDAGQMLPGGCNAGQMFPGGYYKL